MRPSLDGSRSFAYALSVVCNSQARLEVKRQMLHLDAREQAQPGADACENPLFSYCMAERCNLAILLLDSRPTKWLVHEAAAKQHCHQFTKSPFVGASCIESASLDSDRCNLHLCVLSAIAHQYRSPPSTLVSPLCRLLKVGSCIA